jgi:hypothetical protein
VVHEILLRKKKQAWTKRVKLPKPSTKLRRKTVAAPKALKTLSAKLAAVGTVALIQVELIFVAELRLPPFGIWTKLCPVLLGTTVIPLSLWEKLGCGQSGK